MKIHHEKNPHFKFFFKTCTRKKSTKQQFTKWMTTGDIIKYKYFSKHWAKCFSDVILTKSHVNMDILPHNQLKIEW